jgi:DNA polymerase-3 subunit delta'
MSVKDSDIPPVIGHEWALDLLQHGLAHDHLGQAYLFAGPPRIGKTTLALYLAQAVNCLTEVGASPSAGREGRPCGTCNACRKIGQGSHPDVRVIDEPGSSIKIAQMRDLQMEMNLAPFEGQRRVYILCNFQQATLEAANCLLKTLEEPPPRVIMILTAPQAEMLLPTTVSRCQVLNLRPLPTDQVQQALEQHWGLDPRRAHVLARLSGGRIGWAIEASRDDALLRSREKYLVALEQTIRQERTDRVGLAQQLSQNPQGLPEVLDLWQGWWRDLLLAKSGNLQALVNVDRQQTISSEAQDYTLSEIESCLRSIERAAQQIEQNVNATLAMEVLLLSMPRPKDGGTEYQPRPKDDGTGPYSASRMSQV